MAVRAETKVDGQADSGFADSRFSDLLAHPDSKKSWRHVCAKAKQLTVCREDSIKDTQSGKCRLIASIQEKSKNVDGFLKQDGSELDSDVSSNLASYMRLKANHEFDGLSGKGVMLGAMVAVGLTSYDLYNGMKTLERQALGT